MFASTHFIESQRSFVVLEEVEENALKKLIEFAHTGDMTLDSSSVSNVFRGADYLAMIEVKKFCVKHLRENMSFTNVLNTHSLAELYLRDGGIRGF